eukprot:293232_1
MPVVLVIMFALVWIILTSILSIWTYKVAEMDVFTSIIMQKRYIGLSLTSCGFCIARVLTSYALLISIVYNPFNNTSKTLFMWFHSLFFYGILYLLFIRFYMHYFQMNWTAITTSNPWTIHFRKPSSRDQSNQAQHHRTVLEEWFIKHKKTHGTLPSVIRGYCVIFLIHHPCLMILFVSLSPILYHIMESIPIIIFIGCIAYLWKNTPHLDDDDTFLIRKEQRQLMLCIIAACVVYVSCGIVMIFVPSAVRVYCKIANEISIVTMCSLLVYVQTAWISNQINKQIQLFQCDVDEDEDDDEAVQSKRTIHNVDLSLQPCEMSETEAKYDNEITDHELNAKHERLFCALQSAKLLDDFCQYLATELSMEFLFAFIEFTQFRRLMDRSHRMPYAFDDVELPRTIPRSSIVHNRKYAQYPTAEQRYKKIAKKLSEKYLQSGAEFELLINKTTKKKVVDWVYAATHHPQQTGNDHFDARTGICILWQCCEYSWKQCTCGVWYRCRLCICKKKQDVNPYMNQSGDVDIMEMQYLFEECRKEIYEVMSHSADRWRIPQYLCREISERVCE